MKSIGQIRRERLRELQAEKQLTLAAISIKLGRSSRDSTLSQILAGAPDSKTGEPRQMGDKQARALEEAFEKPTFWFDRDPDFDRLEQTVAVLRAHEPVRHYAGAWPFSIDPDRFTRISASLKRIIEQHIITVVESWEADHPAGGPSEKHPRAA